MDPAELPQILRSRTTVEPKVAAQPLGKACGLVRLLMGGHTDCIYVPFYATNNVRIGQLGHES